jgi:hypothetical protein
MTRNASGTSSSPQCSCSSKTRASGVRFRAHALLRFSRPDGDHAGEVQRADLVVSPLGRLRAEELDVATDRPPLGMDVRTRRRHQQRRRGGASERKQSQSQSKALRHPCGTMGPGRSIDPTSRSARCAGSGQRRRGPAAPARTSARGTRVRAHQTAAGIVARSRSRRYGSKALRHSWGRAEAGREAVDELTAK